MIIASAVSALVSGECDELSTMQAFCASQRFYGIGIDESRALPFLPSADFPNGWHRGLSGGTPETTTIIICTTFCAHRCSLDSAASGNLLENHGRRVPPGSGESCSGFRQVRVSSVSAGMRAVQPSRSDRTSRLLARPGGAWPPDQPASGCCPLHEGSRRRESCCCPLRACQHLPECRPIGYPRTETAEPRRWQVVRVARRPRADVIIRSCRLWWVAAGVAAGGSQRPASCDRAGCLRARGSRLP